MFLIYHLGPGMWAAFDASTWPFVLKELFTLLVKESLLRRYIPIICLGTEK